MNAMDVTQDLKQLSLVRSEGYDNIKILGARLDMDNDFKTWVGIIRAFATHECLGDTVTLSFVEFAKLCGIPSAGSHPWRSSGFSDCALWILTSEQINRVASMLPAGRCCYCWG